jgi:hypothetical protein
MATAPSFSEIINALPELPHRELETIRYCIDELVPRHENEKPIKKKSTRQVRMEIRKHKIERLKYALKCLKRDLQYDDG